MEHDYQVMGQNPVSGDETYRYIVLETGEKLWKKPENMTQLTGNVLVYKTHPRIIFRGKLDNFQAKVIELQAEALQQGEHELCDNLEDILQTCRHIMSSEALEVPFEPLHIFGLTEEEIHQRSHNPYQYFGINHPLANCRMSLIALKLNTLRTEVRQVELAGITAHTPQTKQWEKDIVQEMNRLSSAIYLLYCKFVAEK